MTTTSTPSDPTIILIPGHWLGAWAWDDVLEHLSAAGAAATAVTLPGLDEHDPERSSKTLADQAAAIEDVVTRAAGGQGVVLVAHSGANAPVTLVLDRCPELIRRVVWVDSGPVAPGSVFAPDVPEDLAELPLPPFDVLGEQAGLEGLSAEVLDRFRSRAVPEPGPVLRAPVHLTNAARLSVPTTLVCCSISSAQVLELAEAGHPVFAEVVEFEHREFVDLPTGHWPMWSRPRDLAEAIHCAATRAA
ncbi:MULTISPECIES: alpha/beta fold hydrolase [unclassified Pseudactinotalea]|uniref:alpha/beta fold hydrolase n=1 Tax=unclassified Pseudactinotalea TaxID=2649176 RepID=UPI00128E5C3C|nr:MULTISPECIES: alpha/beta fold hydrolase [unclassified Pseudactinotalea]MPV50801.1 alpha/beta fold hydrolase [Pseudactinotalea sp. HY160]QGH70351.1 alpha/beta fold hydrolase [Pseudactinotalea sp. HY158]